MKNELMVFKNENMEVRTIKKDEKGVFLLHTLKERTMIKQIKVGSIYEAWNDESITVISKSENSGKYICEYSDGKVVELDGLSIRYGNFAR